MTEYDKLNKVLEGKSILYIPIYSCFDYQTGNLNFKADGNINRFLSTFYHCNKYKKLDILVPPSGNVKEWFENICKTYLQNCNLISCPLIVKSAKVERSIEFSYKILDFFKTNNIDINSYNYIICEAQHVFLRLYNMVSYNLFLRSYDIGIQDKLIYWCPVCATDNKSRDFLEPYKEIDKFIFSVAKNVIVASNDQVKYYNNYHFGGNLIQIESLIDRQLPFFKYYIDWNIVHFINGFHIKNNIFLPFRLTDMGYQTQKIVDYLYNDYNSNHTFKVFYTNPNNCDIYQFANNDSYKKLFLDKYFIEVPKDRDIFYSIIDYCNVIIPYFEDTEFICHAAIDEFKYGNCIVCKNLDEFKNILS